MALAKPVVVSRTAAIASGYGLGDGENVRLVAPGDPALFAQALAEVLRDPTAAAALGARARETVESTFTWGRYVDRLERLMLAAVAARRDAGSRRG
jgi:glycosyltransferase involved in cell wall biosynthesis